MTMAGNNETSWLVGDPFGVRTAKCSWVASAFLSACMFGIAIGFLVIETAAILVAAFVAVIGSTLVDWSTHEP